MMTNVEHQLVGLIYDAALTHQWETVLTALVEYTESYAGALISFDQLNPETNFMHLYKVPQAFIDSYDAETQTLDMQLHRPQYRQIGLGNVLILDGSNYVKMQGTDEYTFYERCIKTSGMVYCAGILLEDSKYRWTLLGVYRHAGMPKYSDAECHQMKCFAIHMRRALQIYRHLSLTRQQNTDFYRILDRLKTGIIVIDKHAHPLYSNTIAQHILEKSPLLWVNRQQCLKTRSCFQSQLDQLVASIFFQSAPINIDYADIGGVLTLYENPDSPLLKLSIMPLSRLASLKLYQSEPDKAIIFLTTTKQNFQLPYTYLVETYHLSKREIEICELFINGFNLEEIAKSLGISMHSLRTYFKYIYEKTNCSSQIELMHLLMEMTFNFEHIL